MSSPAGAPAPMSTPPRPVVIDTDIGTDIDDSWALAMALRCPELDIRLVTASTGDPAYRAALVADLLAAAGRSDIPVGIGCAGHSHSHETLRAIHRPEALEDHPGGVGDGVEALITALESASGPEPVTILALGPLTTLAAALETRPDLTGRARLVAMSGSHRLGYRGQPGPVAEYNVAQDVEAARRAFAAPWPCTLAPLDTCGSVILSGERLQAVRAAADGDPLVHALLRHQQAWVEWWGRASFHESQTSVLFDTVAVHLCYDESLVEIEEVGIGLSDDGVMQPSPDGPTLRLATTWRDQESFLRHLVQRLTGPPARPEGRP